MAGSMVAPGTVWQAGAVPGLDGGDVHAEMFGEFGQAEEAAGSESFEVAGQSVAAA